MFLTVVIGFCSGEKNRDTVNESQKLERMRTINAIKQLIRFEGSTPNLSHVAGRSVLESIAGLTMEK